MFLYLKFFVIILCFVIRRSGKPPTYMDNPNFNVILVGNSAVGKTSVCLKYKDPTQSLTHFPTVGVDFVSFLLPNSFV